MEDNTFKPIDTVKLEESNEEEITPVDVPRDEVGDKLNSQNDNENDDVIDTNSENELLITDVSNDRGGLFYSLIHFLDDIYVYGRTVIENNYFNFADNADFNLVYPNIYIGNYSTSTNLELLQGIGITHVISVIPTTNPPFPDKFKYLHIQAYDDESQNMLEYFDTSNQFIKELLEEKGKVLIHCMVGRSRSITIFLAFLINIIKGNFNQDIVDVASENDVSNEIEYKKFGNKNASSSANENRVDNVDGIAVKYNNTKNINLEYDDIKRLEYIKPVLSNKYKNFMIYKKQNMIEEINNLINIYNNEKQELMNYADNEASEHLKTQIADTFFRQLLNYVVKYRPIASPNPYFINQLQEILF